MERNMLGTQPDLSKDDSELVFVVPASGTIAMAGDHHFTGGSIYTSAFILCANDAFGLGRKAEDQAGEHSDDAGECERPRIQTNLIQARDACGRER